MAYDVGQTVRVPVTVKDDAGAPINATMAVTVTRPDGTMVTGLSIVNDGTGLYHVDVPASTPGPWQWSWTASGAVATSVYAGQFWVRIPGPRIIGLSELKKHLNKSLTDTSDDDELMDWIDAARWVLESIVGPIIPTTYTETHEAHGFRLIRLRRRPVISVTSVTVILGGDSWTLAAETVPPGDRQFMVDSTGVLWNRSNGYSLRWVGTAVVVYRAGRVVPADNLRMAAREMITHAWRQSQLASGGTRPRTDGPDPISLSYGVPNRVRELLGGQKKAPRLG